MEFTATLQLAGKTATGIRVPDDVIEALGGGNRPQVRVTLRDFSYTTTVARRRGEFKIPVSADVRERAGVNAGDELNVTIERDDTPRELEIPADLAVALAAEPAASAAFAALSYSNRKRHVLAVDSAKTEETRTRRIAKIVSELS